MTSIKPPSHRPVGRKATTLQAIVAFFIAIASSKTFAWRCLQGFGVGIGSGIGLGKGLSGELKRFYFNLTPRVYPI
jgi:hypothetical protein